MENLPKIIIDHLLSECGIIEVLLVVAVVYLAAQLAKTKSAWEVDRAAMLALYRTQSDSYEALAVSHSKIEGILMGLRNR